MGGPHPRLGRRVGAAATLVLAASTLTACGSSGKPTLNWYINPDGQATLTSLAERCSTDDYDIEIQLLPTGATDQRTQLARRLAASDSSTDLMSLDPVFVPEFASAGWLLELPEDVASAVVDDDVLAGPAETVTWEDGVYAAPQWANTQVLWYRQSLADAAGISEDLEAGTATWEQVITAASENGATVGVQADRYEAYMVWINALVQGAGGEIVSNTEAGVDAEVEIDSEAGRAAAAVVQQLADSEAAQSDLSVSREGTSLGAMFAEGSPGEFMTNWTFVYKNYEPSETNTVVTEEQFGDLAWARYPRTVEGEASKPPVGGINIGVGAFTEHQDHALEAAQCVTDPEAQLALAVTDGLMPARASVYDEQELVDAYDPTLLELFRTSVEEGGPRPKSAFYNQISGAVQSQWHSPFDVDPESTPRESAEYLREVLRGEALL
ncbi:extracellular solute-binding protein [Nocardioides sp. ChNu-153]|uniref:extracellular solute-binding protein n=1 Tax=unclassified Nocardioides TaxID=2615069 RepID=UPI0024057D5F|nr:MULTISPECIES: extracellular solute-binding protein [unclassified Nocardioides]MDF9716976.1 extracellular solute-binding protein [Nocardioides sp. ChNu-99]MDN7121394.1 extracellular solute-binding protein [Nocardioides sp. ChNu-153]